MPNYSIRCAEILGTLASLLVKATILMVLLSAWLWIVGSTMDSATEYSIEHDRCLRDATNGLEIKRCR